MSRNKPDPAQVNLLDQIHGRTCPTCGGTILQPTMGGVPRGTCRCQSEAAQTERFTDWSAARIQTVKGLALNDCCSRLVAKYEEYDRAAECKSRGGVALYCPECESRVVFADGRWQREGAA